MSEAEETAAALKRVSETDGSETPTPPDLKETKGGYETVTETGSLVHNGLVLRVKVGASVAEGIQGAE